jgi:hypothetical protein
MNSPVFSTYGVPLHMLSLGPAIANKYARMVMLELTSKIHGRGRKTAATPGEDEQEVGDTSDDSSSTEDSSEQSDDVRIAEEQLREAQSQPDVGVALPHEEDNLSPLDEQYQQFLSMPRPLFEYFKCPFVKSVNKRGVPSFYLGAPIFIYSLASISELQFLPSTTLSLGK